MKAIVLLQHNYRINSDFALAADALAKKMPELTAKAFSANGLDQKRVEVWSNESDETKRYLRITFLTDSLVTHDVVAKADITLSLIHI